jgi:hypothetical protein
MKMGDNITNISQVMLGLASQPTQFIANGQSGLSVVDLGTGADTISAGGAGQILSGGHGSDTFNAAMAGDTIIRNGAAVFGGDTIGGFATGPGNEIQITDIIHESCIDASSPFFPGGPAGHGSARQSTTPSARREHLPLRRRGLRRRDYSLVRCRPTRGARHSDHQWRL